MEEQFTYQLVTYPEAAAGWKEERYWPRKKKVKEQASPYHHELGMYLVHSRVWRETEETGFGVFDYEETTHFCTQLDGGNYQVEIWLGNPTKQAYQCHMRINGIVKKDKITVKPGEDKRISFVACVTDGQFSLSVMTATMEEMGEHILEGDVYIREITLTPAQEKHKRDKLHLFLVGDSTVQSYEPYYYPQAGWGQMFWKYFQGAQDCIESPCENCTYEQARTYTLNDLIIENRAIGGRSTRSFYEEGKLDQVLEVLCPGDYVLIQFGHNDSTPSRPNRYVNPEEYSQYLRMYIEACRRRGAECVLVTPVTMRVFDEAGRFKLAFAEYREQMRKVAKEFDVPVLDLGDESTKYLNRIGEEESKKIYLWLEKGQYPGGAYADGVEDKTHLQEHGADVYAKMVAGLLANHQDTLLLGEMQKRVKVAT